MTVILALKSYWRQPIEISRRTDRAQVGLLLPIGVMIRDPSAGDVSVAWGDITGTLSDQTDLQTALDALTDTDADLQAQVNLKLNIADYNDRFLGLYASVFDLETAHPTASAGDYAQVDWGIGTDVIIYAWDVSDAQWIPVGSSAIANTDSLPEGSVNLYFTTARVIASPLTGLSTATATPITADDSVLSAAGKLQGQASTNATAIAAKLNTADAPATVRSTALTGLVVSDATDVTATDSVLTAVGKLQAQANASSNGYDFLFSRGRANLNRLLFTNLNLAQIIHNGQLTVPAEYNVIGGACLFEFDLYTSATAAQNGTFRIFVSEVNLVNSGASILGANSTDGLALSCQMTFLRAAANSVVLALRVNGTLVAKQRLVGNPNIPAVGNPANFSVRWLSTTGEASLEYVESMVTMGYGNKP